MNPSKYIKVFLPLPFNNAFDYAANDISFEPLDYALTSFRGKKTFSIVSEVTTDIDAKLAPKIKPALAALTANNEKLKISKNFFEFLKWQSGYYLEPLGDVLKLALPSPQLIEPQKQKKAAADAGEAKKYIANLNDEQTQVYQNLKAEIDKDKFFCSIIDGVTGSGKTEVYFKLIADIISNGGQALILLPEIMLTNQVITRFKSHFGIEPGIWHSNITPAKKRKVWLDAATGNGNIFIGARSALYLPYKNLKMIVVDEEHDSSFKQEEGTIYNARDMAIMRAHFESIPILLVSATPSIETYINGQSGKYHVEKLVNRHGEAIMPAVDLIDMREEKLHTGDFISAHLKNEISACIDNGKQALLFLNRRGYAPLTLCGKCGFRFKSPDTSTWLVQHHDHNGNIWLECHHTGYKIRMPEKCPECGEKDSFRSCGPGVQRIAEEVQRYFPNAKTEMITSDTISTPKKAAEIIRRIEQKEIDIIIGTQMIAKGHNFPALTLVGIVDGDLGLEGSDIRAGEKCFQVLQQVAGRAGRVKEQGKVLIQSYLPEHPVMQALKHNDRDNFYKYEIESRVRASLPPYSKLAAIIVSSKSEVESSRVAKLIVSKLRAVEGVNIYGPVNSLIYLLRGQYRNRLLLKAQKNFNIQKYISEQLAGLDIPKTVKVKIDIDPHNFF